MTGHDDPHDDHDDHHAGLDDHDGPDSRHGDDDLDELIHRADLDGLVRLVDARCESRDWDGLRRLRDRSRAALSTGRQLWPAATLAEYRLALLAPAAWAAGVLDESSGRFTIGPLSEVIAQHHHWDELAPELRRRATEIGPRAVYVAHERALRGDEIDPDELADGPRALEIPMTPRPWEPAYPLATYRDESGEFPSPALPTLGPTIELDPVDGQRQLDDPVVDDALRHLVAPWLDDGHGHLASACVEGEAPDAIAALGLRRARLGEITAADALAWLGWAGASGGSHGRRRGAAAGRDSAWWVLGALGELHDEWPPHDAAVEDLLGDLRWWWWDAAEPTTGWQLRLVVTDATDGVAWAWAASDAV